MTPPELTTDAPVLNVLHPVSVCLRPPCWAVSDITTCNSISGFLHTWVFKKPLHRDTWFDGHVGTLREADVIVIFLNADE